MVIAVACVLNRLITGQMSGSSPSECLFQSCRPMPAWCCVLAEGTRHRLQIVVAARSLRIVSLIWQPPALKCVSIRRPCKIANGYNNPTVFVEGGLARTCLCRTRQWRCRRDYANCAIGSVAILAEYGVSATLLRHLEYLASICCGRLCKRSVGIRHRLNLCIDNLSLIRTC